jgi:hypothetical protein
LGAWAVHLKATYLQIKIYWYSVILLILLGRLADLIVSLSMDNSGGTRLSDGNILIVILLFVAVVLPVRYYKRIVHLGASREQYFKGLQSVFAVWAAALALFNSLWLVLEVNVLEKYSQYIDLIKVFRWDNFGFAGIFLYQFVFYLMVMALISMLISGYQHPLGWLLSALLIAAIPIGTSIASLRVHVGSFFQALLFNDSLLKGAGYNLILYLIFTAGCWYFTRRRTH